MPKEKSIEERRKELLREMDTLTTRMGIMSGDFAKLQKEFRSLELRERAERANLSATNAPSGILK